MRARIRDQNSMTVPTPLCRHVDEEMPTAYLVLKIACGKDMDWYDRQRYFAHPTPAVMMHGVGPAYLGIEILVDST
jgi:hypothetical protein